VSLKGHIKITYYSSNLVQKIKAQRERFELPSPRDSGFRIHRNTGLCDLCTNYSKKAMKISVMGVEETMRIKVLYQDTIQYVETEEKITIKEVLIKTGIHASMVLVCNESQIIPQTSVINSDIELEVIDVGSGG
jgi:sulfur carrier protein ThiS